MGTASARSITPLTTSSYESIDNSPPDRLDDRLPDARQVAAKPGVSERFIGDRATPRSPRILSVKLGKLLRPEFPLMRGKDTKASLQQDTLTTVEAAAMLGISPATLRGWKAQRIGPPFIQLSPRCVRYDHRDIQQYVHERRCVPGCDRRPK